jgi:hypothetical protein
MFWAVQLQYTEADLSWYCSGKQKRNIHYEVYNIRDMIKTLECLYAMSFYLDTENIKKKESSKIETMPKGAVV